MTYKVRPGIVMVEICDAPILVAKRELWDDFPHVYPLSFIGKVIWKLTDHGSSWEQIVRICSIFTRKTQEEGEVFVREFCDRLVKDGYMLEVSEAEFGNNELLHEST